jgi:hypothetical protein
MSAAEMEKNGITILTGCTVTKIDKHGKDSPPICRTAPASPPTR